MRNWLKNLRQEKNLNQSQTAKLMGISRQYYSYIEAGERLLDLTFSIAIKLSNIFNISLDDIKNFEEKEPQNENYNKRH